MTESFLKYYGKNTNENAREIYKKMELNQSEIAKIANITIKSYESWLTDKKWQRTPKIGAWNCFILELEAKRLGYDNALDFYRNNSNICIDSDDKHVD